MTSIYVRHNYLLRQSGIPIDHENEFFTKGIYSQIGLKCFAIKVLCIYPYICQRVMVMHMTFSIPIHLFVIDNVQKCVFMELLFCIRRLG